MGISVAWIGEGPEPTALMIATARVVHREFGLPGVRVRIDGRPPPHELTFDPRRGQHSSRAVLSWLGTHRPEGSEKLLGVTDVDLFIPVLTFVFGEAQLGGPLAVVSIARLREPASDTLLQGRLLKEAVHELGHTFGLVHCASMSCVMARSPGIGAVDRKEDQLCPDCRIRYRDLREQMYVAARHPHSDR
jgi:archaemetzincin